MNLKNTIENYIVDDMSAKQIKFLKLFDRMKPAAYWRRFINRLEGIFS